MRATWTAAWILTVALLMAGCAATTGQTKSGRVQHVVVCWLNEPGNEAARRSIIEASKSFAEIPGVLSVSAGRVLPSERPIVDSSFDVAIVVTLRDAAVMPAYLNHPTHQRAAKEVLQPVVRKTLVYDFAE